MSLRSAAPLVRCKHALATHGTVVAVAALALGLCCLLVIATPLVTAPVAGSPLAPADAASDTRETHSVALETTHATTVSNATTAYDAGERLRDRSRYPLGNTADLEYAARATPTRASVDRIALELVYAAAPRGSPDESFWSTRRTLANRTGGESNTGDQVNVSVALPIEEIDGQRRSYQNEFGADVRVTADLEVRVAYSYAGTDDTVHERTLSATDPIRVHDSLYEVGTTAESRTHATGTAPTAGDEDAAVNGLLGVLGLLGLGSSAVAFYGDRRFDAATIERTLERRRFDEWVTEVDQFTPSGDLNVVFVNSLADLVDLAIDVHERVLYVTATEEYVVVDGQLLFVYSRRPTGAYPLVLSFGMGEPGGDAPEPFDPEGDGSLEAMGETAGSTDLPFGFGAANADEASNGGPDPPDEEPNDTFEPTDGSTESTIEDGDAHESTRTRDET